MNFPHLVIVSATSIVMPPIQSPPRSKPHSESSMSDYYQQTLNYAPVEVERNDSAASTSATMLLRLCLYGFFIELKPSEAYLNAFLTIDKGFTNVVTNEEIYPWFTYGQLAMLLVMPLVVERVPYRSVLLIESLGFLLTRAFILWGTSLFLMQLMQVTYAIGTVSKVVYLCMIYREVSPEEYHSATAAVWASSLAGQFVAGLLGQLLVWLGVDLWWLNYISLANVCIAFALAFSVPEHAAELIQVPATAVAGGDETSPEDLTTRRRKRHLKLAKARTWQWTNFLAATWITLKCCESLSSNYIQNRWTSFTEETLENGVVMALYTASGALIMWILTCAGQRKARSAKSLQWFLFSGSVIIAGLSYVQTIAPSLELSYGCYILYGAVYYGLITTVSAELALQCSTDHYAKMFSVVALGAASLETMITFLLQGTTTLTTTWFGTITVVHGILLAFYLFFYCRLEPEPLPDETQLLQVHI
ncbi:unnamed protein product [Aphanomyces euteiches]